MIRMSGMLLLVAVFMFMSSNTGASDTAAAESATRTQAVVQGNDAFALDLYAKLRAESKGNLFFSPYSISSALAMTYAGARGKTAAEMAEVLHFTLPQDRLPPAFAALAAKLHGDIKKEGYQLRIANRLWGQAGEHFLPEFLKTTRDNYGAELAQVDFVKETEAARRAINAWTEDKTEKKIKDLLAPGVLDPTTVLVLTNAVYFKADWQKKFKTTSTHDAPFLVAPNEKVTAPMMRQTDEFAYGVIGEVHVLELPYLGKDLSMFVLLPKEVDGLANLEKKLSVETLNAWTSGLREQTVEVSCPSSRSTSSFQLEKVLGSMGMPQAFTDEADFSGMAGKRELFYLGGRSQGVRRRDRAGHGGGRRHGGGHGQIGGAGADPDLPRRSSVPLSDSRQPDRQHPVPGTNDQSKSVINKAHDLRDHKLCRPATFNIFFAQTHGREQFSMFAAELNDVPVSQPNRQNSIAGHFAARFLSGTKSP